MLLSHAGTHTYWHSHAHEETCLAAHTHTAESAWGGEALSLPQSGCHVLSDGVSSPPADEPVEPLKPFQGPVVFTCLGCQVLPSPSLMQHGCPLNLFVSAPLVSLPWRWPSAGQPSRGGTHTHTHTLLHKRIYSSYGNVRRVAGTDAGVSDPCRDANLPALA